MGKSFELLGLAAFNILLAIVLSAKFLSGGADAVRALTQDNVAAFINEAANISAGKNEDMKKLDIIDYLMAHVSDDGVFKSTIDFTLPDAESDSRTLEMSKQEFISHVIEGLHAMDKHETAVTIEYVRISADGRNADVRTTNYERGMMPVDDGMGGAEMMPVTGTSYCEQKLLLSEKNIIQMAGADCSTSINFAAGY